MREKEIIVDPDLLIEQMDELLSSDITEPSKTGLHNLLGELLDCLESKIETVILLPGKEE